MFSRGRMLKIQWAGFVSNDEGATSIEYSLIAAGMSSALIAAFEALLSGGGLLAGINELLAPEAPPPPPQPPPPEPIQGPK